MTELQTLFDPPTP